MFRSSVTERAPGSLCRQYNCYVTNAAPYQKALKAKYELENAKALIQKECVVNWNNYLSANALIQSSQSAVKSATVSSESELEESEMGLKSNTDVWVRENELLKSKVDFTESQKQKFMSAVKLLELCGKLNRKYIVAKARAGKNK